MKLRAATLAWLLLAACSQQPRTEKAARDFLAAASEPYALRLEPNALLFCDSRGARRIDLTRGEETAASFTCAVPDEPNTACAGISDQISVRTPPGSSTDIIDANGISIPVNGKVHDCAGLGDILLAGTAAEVLLLDTKNNTRQTIAGSGADRVAINPAWVAWASGTRLQWKAR